MICQESENPFKIYIIYALILFLCGVFPLSGAIKKRVLPDGSIEYYTAGGRSKTTSYGFKRNFPVKYSSIIDEHAKKHGVDPRLVECVIKIESDFRSDAVSSAGAQGLMQLMPATGAMYHITDPFDPDQNIRAGVRHLSVLLKQTGNEVPLALAAYHAGLSRVKKNMSVPDIDATVHYVNKVMYLYTGEKDAALKSKPLRKIISGGVIEITN